MSLVNDALKRAQDAQKRTHPAAQGPQFRPPEPAETAKRSMGIWVPMVIGMMAIVGLILAWENQHKAQARQPAVATKLAAPVVAVAQAKPPVQPAPASAPAPAPPVAVTEKPTAPPVVSAPAPQLKLQAIFYVPGHSSAIINGKTVRVGDNFHGFRVAALTQTSATLVSTTQTNVMRLQQD